MAAKTTPKKKKIQRKNAIKRYPKVEIELPEIFDEKLVLPDTNYLPNPVLLAVQEGRMSEVLKFWRDNGFEDVADAWGQLVGKDENREFIEEWFDASTIEAPKSDG